MDFEKLSDKLIETLSTADETKRSELATMLEEYAEKYPTSWYCMRNASSAALSYLVDALVMGVDARPGLSRQLVNG